MNNTKNIKFVVRLSGEGEQYEISKKILDKINKHDNKIVSYLNKAREINEKIRKEIESMHKAAKTGTKVDLKKSDFIIPQKDITLDEAMDLFEGEGIIPG